MKNRGLPLEWSDKTILRMKNAIFHDYYNRIRNIALSRYEWRDLPDDMNERYIEWLLFYNGKCVFFYDEILENISHCSVPQPARWTFIICRKK